MSPRQLRSRRAGHALCIFLGVGACSASGLEARAPGAMQERDTEMKHEPCDLASTSAVATDANGDGRPDIIRVYEGGREVCRAADINMDTVIDVFIYFDAQGLQRRRESGFDRDERPDEISIFERGQLVMKMRETNNDGKLDTWDHYQAGRLVREERDSTGDGYVDQWWSFPRPDKPSCAIVVIDSDGDGRPDPATQLDLCAEASPGGPQPTPVAPAAPDGGASVLAPPPAPPGAAPGGALPAGAQP